MTISTLTKRYWIIASVCAAIISGVWYSQSSIEVQNLSQRQTIPYQNTLAIAQGEEIYQKQCAACHGANLEGQANWQTRDSLGYLPAPPHDQTGHTWHHADQQLFTMVKGGVQAIVGKDYRTNMLAFESQLSDSQIWSVLAYIKSKWPQEIIAAHNRFSES